ncbi:replication initiation and membrane attachment family protein [Virgibacillus kimchii]
MKSIGKILPVDGYYASIYADLPLDYTQSLTHLYQPLIGSRAVTLYQTLLHEIDLQVEQQAQTHHTLMNYLNLPLDEIYRTRVTLEGIGLLRVFEKQTEGKRIFIYELQPPFGTKAFFTDAMLTQLLYHHIGEAKFSRLKNYFSPAPLHNRGKEITAGFHEIFETIQPMVPPEVITENNVQGMGDETEVDFSWLEQMLKQRMIPAHRVLSKDNRKIIAQMMQLYELEMFEIEKSLQWALTEENELHIEEFKTACHDLFKTKNNGKTIKLTEKETTGDQQMLEKPVSKEEQLIHELETISPKQLLEDLSKGKQASEQDMKVIREVMVSQGLPSPVMNVLIHYVLLQSNMRLSKGYMEKIASHWSRANLSTAKEAMRFAKKEKERYRNKQKTRTNNYYKKPVSTEVVPDWFKERKQKQKAPEIKRETADVKQEQKEIEALLRQYSSGSKN